MKKLNDSAPCVKKLLMRFGILSSIILILLFLTQKLLNKYIPEPSVRRGPGFAPAGPFAPAKLYDPAPGGAAAPAKYSDPAPGGAVAPAKYSDPAPGGAAAPASLPDPAPGGARPRPPRRCNEIGLTKRKHWNTRS